MARALRIQFEGAIYHLLRGRDGVGGEMGSEMAGEMGRDGVVGRDVGRDGQRWGRV